MRRRAIRLLLIAGTSVPAIGAFGPASAQIPTITTTTVTLPITTTTVETTTTTAAPTTTTTEATTTTTAPVEPGVLTISAPASAALSTAAPSGLLSGVIGDVTVTDTRAGIGLSWVATVASSDFLTGGASAPETVSRGAVSYWSGTPTATTGVGTFVPGQANSALAVTLDVSRTAFTAVAGVSGSSVTWRPTVSVSIPAAAISGVYTGTITHSVA